MEHIINFSRPELFLIGIIIGHIKKKNEFLTDLKKYIPGKNRIPGSCSNKFLLDVYRGLVSLKLIKELDTGEVILSKNGNFFYNYLNEKAQLFNYGINDVLNDILHYYNKSIFDTGPGIVSKGELLILEQMILISNPIINFLTNILQRLILKKDHTEFSSKEIFSFAIENHTEFVKMFLIKKNAREKYELTYNDIKSVIYDDIKNQMRNSKLIKGDYRLDKFPDDKWRYLKL